MEEEVQSRDRYQEGKRKTLAVVGSQGREMKIMESKKEEDRKQDLAVEQWQHKLLPFMRGGLAVLAVLFFVASLVQYHLLYQDLRGMGPTTQAALETLEKGLQDSQRTKFDFIRWKTLVLLEQDSMRMRYQQINATLLLRTWTRYTGFLVGMVLALVGAFFILGRLKEDASQLSGESGGFKFALVSSSPGVILAVLGTILMVVTLAVKFDFEVNDRPVFLPLHALSAKTDETLDSRNASQGSSTHGAAAPPQALPRDAVKATPVGPDDFPKPPAKASP